MRKKRTAPPPDDVLRRVVSSVRSFDEAARILGVDYSTVHRHAHRLGVRTLYEVRPGLPDDETLWQDMYWCETFRDVADRYGVPEHTIRNEAKRLGITAPSKRAELGRTREVMAPFA